MVPKHWGMVGLAVAALVVATAFSAVLAIPGCGGKSVVQETSREKSSATSPATEPSTGAGVTIYLLKGETLTGVTRKVSEAGAEVALTEMLKGPSDAEVEQGFATAIPDGTRLLSYRVEGGKATVDFSDELKNYGGGSAGVQGIVGQITSTVTSNDKRVTSVEITIAGVPAEESLQP
jgi:spore germination protein GerM